MRNKTVFSGQQLNIVQEGAEIRVTARYNGQDLSQVISQIPPYVVLFDPTNLNFEAHTIESNAVEKEYVTIIDSVVETAVQR